MQKVAGLSQTKATYLNTLSAGLYKVIASTNVSGPVNVTFYETINKVTPTLSATINGNTLGTLTFRDVNLSLAGSVNSPLTANFYDNGIKLGSSPQTIIYGYSTLGNNVIVFNASGNQNYTAGSITGTINLTTNQWTIQDNAQNGAHLSTFNLTVKNSTTTKNYVKLAYGSTILYQSLPAGSDTFNFTSAGYNWTVNSSANSIFTTVNQTLTGIQWEWISFNVKNKQTQAALTGYGFNLTDTNLFKYLKGSTSNPVTISLQKLYSGTATIITNITGYNLTKTTINFQSLSPTSNTYTIFMAAAALTIYVRDMNTQTLFPNATITISNVTASDTFTNITTPLSKTYLQIPLGNITITVSRDWPTKTSWTTSTYYTFMSAESAINLTTYIFNASDETTLTFQVQNAYGSTVSGAIIYLESMLSPNNILSECQTLGAGQCQIYGNYGSSYLYYGALPFTYQISPISPLYTLKPGSEGICPSGIWCAYLQTVLPTLAAVPFTNISYSPQDSFLTPNTTVPFSVNYSTTKNDVSLFEDNYSVYTNNTLVHSVLYTFSGNPTKGGLAFDQTTPISSFTSYVEENVSLVQNGVITSFHFIYYIEGSPGGIATNSTSLANLSGLFKGLGAADGMIFFWIVLVGVAVLVWVLSGSALATMLIMDAVTGLFAFFNVFSGAIGGYGSYLGWGMFALFSFFTITYQMSKMGGLS